MGVFCIFYIFVFIVIVINISKIVKMFNGSLNIDNTKYANYKNKFTNNKLLKEENELENTINQNSNPIKEYKRKRRDI